MLQAISYGVNHEKDGVAYYEKTLNVQVVMTGIHFLPCGFLGASPDGLVGADKIIEVKCPFSLRNKTFEEALNSRLCCLVKDSSGKLQVKRNHNYYDQVQGCMYVTGRTKCDFVYWTKKWQAIVEVELDKGWGENIELLSVFYEEIMLPFLLNN